MPTINHLEQKNLTIIELLGQGGSGAVYQAHQAILDREVAVKVILPTFANHPDFIRNFELEAQLIARLEHPYIVPLYDFWRDPEGAYLVMRYLRGGSLKKRLEQGALSFEEIDRVLEQLTSALTAAHRASVVHRDLKPENILLDEDGNAYLSDFGIARRTGHSPTEENISGTLAYMAPEQLMSHPTSVAMDIYSLGLILFEMLTGQYPYSGYSAGQIVQMHINETLPDLQVFKGDLPDVLNTIIQKATSKKPEDRFSDSRDLWRDFHRAVSKGDPLKFDREPVERRNPYKGLRPFDETDADDFFGREALIDQVLDRMTEDVPYRNFLAVIGASGSGKSSLVRAGVIPALRAGKITGSKRWFICEMVPGSSPLSTLTQALLSVAPGAPPRLQEQLASNPQALLWAIDNMMANVEGDLLLFIDQFEELFILAKDESERTHFLELIRYAVSAAKSRFRVIVTLRADFYDRPLHYEGFGEIIQQRSQVVLSLNATEIERAISGPADRVDVHVNTDLITAIVSDMREEPGALPLLQYALTEVFERSDGHHLTLKAYRESGGVEGALARRAEDVYQNLSTEEQEIAHQLFLRLVSFGEHTADTRRRTTQSELFSINDAARVEVEKVLSIFGSYRLLAFDRHPVTREPVIEIAHEALIRGWERLRNWLDESREDLRTQRQLAALADEWLRSKRDESYLVRGTRLNQFKDWAAVTTLNLATLERDLLDTSIQQAKKETETREVAQREKELLQVRTQKQQRQLIFGLIIGFIITSGLGGMALLAGNQARTEANQNATAQFIAEQARSTSEANTSQLRTALDEIRSLNMGDTALQDLMSNDIDSAIALAFAANQIGNPPQEAQRVLASVADKVGTAKLFEGHTRDVQALAFSPNGQQLVSGAYDRTLILWNVADGVQIRQMEGHQDIILSVAYSPDGKYIVSGDASGVILLWDAETGEQVREYKAHSENVHAIVFSPDGTKLVSASADAMLIMWNLKDATIIHHMTGHFTAVTTVSFSTDGKQLVSGAIDGSVIIWNADSGEIIQKWEGDGAGINAVAFNPQHTQVISGGNDNSLKLWNAETGELIQTFSGHRSPVLSAAFSPDGQQLVSGSADNTLRLWDTATAETLRVYQGHTGRIHAVSFSPDGSWIASASADDTVRLWLTQYIPINLPLTLSGHTDDVKQVVFSPDESMVLSGAGTLFDDSPMDTSLILWDWKTGHALRQFMGHEDSITSVAFSPDGQKALSASRDHSLILWDVQTGSEIRRFIGHSDWVWDVVFSPDGQEALSASRDHSLILWDVQTGSEIRRFIGHSDWVNAGVFSPNGKQIVSGADDGKVILWDAVTGQTIRVFEGHEGPVHDVQFSPDGTTILSGSSDWSSILWDSQSGEKRYQFFDQQGAINAVTYSADGSQMVTGSADGSLIVWDASTGERIRDFRVEGEIVRSTSFSPDGLWLIASFDSGMIRVYPLNKQVVMDWIAQHVYLRPLDCTERQKFAVEPLCESN